MDTDQYRASIFNSSFEKSNIEFSFFFEISKPIGLTYIEIFQISNSP